MTARRGPSSRALAVRWALAIALVTAFLVWNVVFDLWLGQGERQYLWQQAQRELGRGSGVSLKGSMERSIQDALWVASAWALVVAGAVLLAAYLSYRFARRREGAGDA